MDVIIFLALILLSWVIVCVVAEFLCNRAYKRKLKDVDTYSGEITDEKLRTMDKAMMKKSGLSGVELYRKLNDGILVSGEEW